MIRFKKFTIFLLWASCIFDPLGSLFGIKFIALCFLATFFIVSLLLNVFPKIRLGSDLIYIVTFVVFFMPTYGILLSIIRGGVLDVFIDTSYIVSGIYILFVFLIIDKELFCYSVSIMNKMLVLLSVIIIIVYATIGSGLGDFFYNFFVNKGVAYISYRTYNGIELPYIYFITSPLIIFLVVKLSFDISKSFTALNFFLLLLSSFALFLSGTRVNVIASIAGVVVAFLWAKFGKLSYLILFSVTVTLSIVYLDKLSSLEMFSLNESSNSTKFSYLSYYWHSFSSIDQFIFGQGYNAHVWSTGLKSLLVEGGSKLELTYLEVFRVYGLIVATAFVILLFRNSVLIAYERHDMYSWVQPAVVLYLGMCALNPYLFSMNGMMALSVAIAYKYIRNASFHSISYSEQKL